MIRRLRLKFICVNMAIVLVMMALMTVAVLYFTQRSLARESLHAMQQIAMDPLRPQAPGKAADGVRLPYFVLEVDETGAVHAAGGGYYDLSDTGFLAQAAAQIEAEGAQSGVLRAYGLRFLRAETPHGKYIVFADMSHEHSTLSGLLRTCLRISLAGSLVFLAISTLLAHLAVRPVEEAWAQQKQFVADASHELKTPLTVLLANAELMCAEGSTPCEQQALARGGCAALWKSCWSWHGPTAACWSPRAPGWIGPRKRTRRFCPLSPFALKRALCWTPGWMRAFLCAATPLCFGSWPQFCWTTRANILRPARWCAWC